jgi:hypothetical protein
MTTRLITPELEAHLEGLPGMYATTASPDRVPEVTRVLSARAEPGNDVLRVVVAGDSSTRFLECARAHPRAALVGVVVSTYRTYQFKGRVVGVEDATPEDVAAVDAYTAGFGELVKHVGIDPVRYLPTIAVPPYVVLRLGVDAIFDQTPRVGAGALVSRTEEAAR